MDETDSILKEEIVYYWTQVTDVGKVRRVMMGVCGGKGSMYTTDTR